jgi:HK97 gp10 family phage protein
MNIAIEGLDELIRDLAAFGDEALKEIEKEQEEAGNILLNKAREKVPVDTGELKNSLYVKRQKTKPYILASVLTWRDNVRAYGAPVELGHGLVFFGKKTGKMVKARPFLRPATDESREKIFNTLISGMDRALKKFGEKA